MNRRYKPRFLAQEAIAVISLIGIGFLLVVVAPFIFEAIANGEIQVEWVRR